MSQPTSVTLALGLAALVGLTALALPKPAHAPAAVELIAPYGPIPEGYETWSLFLICNPEWLVTEREDELRALYERFLAFGWAIGADNLAVWFWKQPPEQWNPEDPFSANIDVERSTAYCRAFGLLPSEAPHVLVTTQHPDRSPEDRLTVSLKGLSSPNIATLLAKLADQLVVLGLNQGDLESERYWIGWQNAVEDVLHSAFGWIDRVSAKIDTRFLTVEVEGGPG